MNPADRDREPHRGLRIEMAIGLVVVGCGLGGLVLATVLAFAWGNVERKTLEISDRSAAVSDLRRLDAELDNWALNVDLVLGGSVGSSLLDTDATATLLRDLLGRIEWDAIQTLRGDLTQYIDDEVNRLHEAVQLFGQDRDSHLPRLLAKSDAEFGPLIERFKKIDLEIQQFILGEEAELAASRSTLRLVSWVATILYLLFIAVLWRWASRSITRPLATLAQASHEALGVGVYFHVEPTGPREVRMLTESMSELTGTLESLVRDRTAAIEQMAMVRAVTLDTVPFPLAHIGADDRLVTCNQACAEFFGIDNPTVVEGVEVSQLPMGTLIADGKSEQEWTDGVGRRHNIQVLTAAVETGGLVLCIVDVTERVADAARLRNMLRELDHRVRNTLASILSLVQLEQRNFGNEGALGVLSGRVQSMARAYELLGMSQWHGVDLLDAARIILEPWVSDQKVGIDGASIKLLPEAATPICMLLNELTTNAVKHGALASSDGRVELRWIIEGTKLDIYWAETGGQQVQGPPAEVGSGLSLIEGFVRHDLEGELTWTWAHEGLRCHIVLHPSALC